MVRYERINKYPYCLNKYLLTYKDKEKLEDENVIVSTFLNETNIDVNNKLEGNGECQIISKFKVKKN